MPEANPSGIFYPSFVHFPQFYAGLKRLSLIWQYYCPRTPNCLLLAAIPASAPTPSLANR